jgi:hypothetical protein
LLADCHEKKLKFDANPMIFWLHNHFSTMGREVRSADTQKYTLTAGCNKNIAGNK